MKKLFPLTSGEWLFFTGLVYFVVGMVDIFWYRFAEPEYIQMVWLTVVALPLFVPMRRIVRINTIWRM